MYTKATLVTLAAAAAPAMAQLGGLSISQQCLTALTGQLLQGETSSCLAVSGLLPLLSTPADQSLVPVLASYQTQLCAAPTCSNDTITGLVTSFLDGCSQDLEQQNVPITDATRQVVLDNAPEVYNLIKDVACLRNATTSQESGSSCADGSVFCLQDLLNNIETDLNVTLSIDYLGQLLQQLPTADSGDILDILNELPTSTVCTDCNSAAYSLIESVFPGVANITLGDTMFEAAAAQKCGAAFPDAGISSDVEQYTDYCPASSTTSPARLRLARWL